MFVLALRWHVLPSLLPNLRPLPGAVQDAQHGRSQANGVEHSNASTNHKQPQ